MDQPGKVANPARGQLNRGKFIFPCPRACLRIWSRETGSAVPSRVSLLISILRLNLVLTYYLRDSSRVSAAASIYETAMRHRVSPKFIVWVAQSRTDGVHCRESACLWSAGQGKLIFPCPRACLRIWSRETGSAVPSRVACSSPYSG